MAAIDLTTAILVKQYLPQAGSANDDVEIQAIITACSQAMLDLTGRDSLNTLASYTEIRNGNGSPILFTKNAPITTVTSVAVNGATIPIATGYNTIGAAVNANADAIVLQGQGMGTWTSTFINWSGPPVFTVGLNNVQIVYSAGYASTPADLQDAVTRWVAQQLMRRQYIDQATKSVDAAGGTARTTYWTKLMWEPYVREIAWKYTRVSGLY